MKTIRIEKEFRKDLERDKKSGIYSTPDFETLKQIISLLENDETIAPIYKRHTLRGSMGGFESIHIKNDWILIFSVDDLVLTLVALGKHTQVYKKFK